MTSLNILKKYKLDDYTTPLYVWEMLLDYLDLGKNTIIYEPFYNDGASKEYLGKLGYNKVIHFEENFFEKEAITKPVSPLVQLSYVLPRNCLYMLPTKIKDKLLGEYDHCYTFDVEFEWSFCKYFWECHMHLPEIDISKLEKLIL